MWLIKWLTELNLFEKNATDNRSVQNQRSSTRFYICALSLALFIISVYTLLTVVPERIEIHDPTFNVYKKLPVKYSPKCACSNVSVPYEQFVRLEPRYHQVCSSDFVTQRWIDFLYDPEATPFYYPEDFRATASQQFQLLAILCRMRIQAINASLRSFSNTSLVAAELLSEKHFDAQIQAHIDAFKTNTLNKFNHTLAFVRNFFFSNTLLSVARTFLIFGFQYMGGSWSSTTIWSCLHYPEPLCCYCSVHSTCKIRAGFFSDKLDNNQPCDSIYAHLDIVDGWYVGCLPIDSLLHSTLKSFYNQAALNSFLLFFRNSSSNFTCLNANHPTIFPPSNTTLETIVEASFIEEWKDNISYLSYFNMCRPKLCVYHTNESFNILHSITTVLGLYSGFSIDFRFPIPMIIKLVIWFKQRTRRTKDELGWRRKLKRVLLEFNLFKSAIHVEPRDICQQQ
jgi:hypothetical protein